MTNQSNSSDLDIKTVGISHDNEIRLNAKAYQPHFKNVERVRIGTHPEWDLIFVQPAAGGHTLHSLVHSDSTYSIDSGSKDYTGELSCKGFLQRHNYHHTATTWYVAEWWPEYELLCVDLTDPVSEERRTAGTGGGED